jgi:hypothetical protein
VSIIFCICEQNVKLIKILYPKAPLFGKNLTGKFAKPKHFRKLACSLQILVDKIRGFPYNIFCNTSYGGVAQLGERLNGIQEVMSSILTVSTT